MQQRIVIEFDERFERDVQALAVIKHGTMVIRNPPRTGIKIKSLFEFAALAEAAELDIFVATAERPVSAARAAVEFQNLNLVAGVAQFQRRCHPSQAGAKNENGRAFNITVKLDRTFVA